MAVDPATPDSKRMLSHPYYQQTVNPELIEALRDGPVIAHHNSGVILFNKKEAGVMFARWRASWQYWREQDEPCLILAQRDWPATIHTLDPRWNFLCNPEKKDEVIAEGIRKAGILHLCGLNKAKNYNRITQLLLSRTSSRTSAPKGAPSQSP
jgi:hypothetical protein